MEFREIKERAETLLELGRETDRRIRECQLRIQEDRAQVAEAEAALAEAGENGSMAQVRLNMARNHLAASQRALAAAQEEGGRVRQEKQAHVQAIEQYSETALQNLNKLRNLSGMAFGEISRDAVRDMAQRRNQAEIRRAELLRSMGIEAAADLVAEEPPCLDRPGGGFSALLGEAALGELYDRMEAMARQAEYISPPEDGKVLRLTPQERWENGLRYINRLLEITRDDLRDMGVDSGPAMEQELALLRQTLLQELSKDIAGEENRLYDALDQSALAERIQAGAERFQQTEALTSQERECLRKGIRDGEVTERDIRAIGRRIRERYDRLDAARRQEAEALRQEHVRLAAAYKQADSQEMRDRLELQRRALMERERANRERSGRLALAVDALRAVRPVGPGESSQRYTRGASGTTPVIRALNEVREYLPSDWVEKSNPKPIRAKYVLRGYFDWGEQTDTIALSGLSGHMRSCAFHEMGHRFERLYPEIREIEKQFYERRTAGESLRWLGLGYPASEKSRFDQFTHPYMGKDYGGVGYEILSMGLEGVFCGKYNTGRDPEFQDLIFGLLAAI